MIQIISTRMPDRLPKLLVTGAAGRVGKQICSRLQPYCQLFMSDLHAAPEEGIFAVDILDEEKLTEAATGMDAILHCAVADYLPNPAPHEDKASLERRYHNSVIEVNLRGVYHLYEAACRAKVPHIIYISSMTVLLGAERSEYSPEQPPCPINFYGVSKLFGEQLGELYARTKGIQTTALRLGQPYPIGLKQEAEWIENEQHRKMLVSHDVTTKAILDALHNPPPFFKVAHVIGGIIPFTSPTHS